MSGILYVFVTVEGQPLCMSKRCGLTAVGLAAGFPVQSVPEAQGPFFLQVSGARLL